MTDRKIKDPIRVDHLARIEGKAGLEVTIDENQVKEIKVNIIQGPRFFEAITVGKPLNEATAVFPRICSFCASAHKITALEAAENAINLEVSEQTKHLRELMYLGDQIESHALHLFLLALPDFMGYTDGFSMAKEYPDTIKIALKLKDIGARIQTVLGSRYIHQENAIIGGFGKLPHKTTLSTISNELGELKVPSELALELFGQFDLWPEVTAERTHMAIKPYNESYTVLGDTVVTTTKDEFSENTYKDFICERVVPHSFAKHSFYNNKPFMTGAISRYTLFKDRLTERAKELGRKYQDYLVPNNPLSNNFAQAVELVHFVERAQHIADMYTEQISNEQRPIIDFDNAGLGISLTEAPRGIVAYTLDVDTDGIVKAADVITPTSMFLALMEADLGKMAQGLIDQGIKDENTIKHKLETVVRSYDPCVSCSVHITGVKQI